MVIHQLFSFQFFYTQKGRFEKRQKKKPTHQKKHIGLLGDF